jgi:hypothetical protein
MECLTEGGAAGMVLGTGFVSGIIWYTVCYVAAAHTLKFRFSWLQILLSFLLTALVIGVVTPIIKEMARGNILSYSDDLFGTLAAPPLIAVAIIWLFLRTLQQGVRNVRVIEEAPRKD